MDFEGGAEKESVRVLIEQVGAEVRFLPAYSRDLNPIEMIWSKVKFVLRKAQPRTRPDPLAAISFGLGLRHPAGCLRLVHPLQLQFYLKCSISTLG